MRTLTLAVMLVLLTSCISMAPKRERPQLPGPDVWPQADSHAPLQGWAEFFPDPALQILIRTALSNSRSLRQTVAAMEQARAQWNITQANRLPHIELSAETETTRRPADLRAGASGVDRSWSVATSITTFELDFFGRVRNLHEAALEDYLATEEAHRAAHIALIAQIARTYLRLAANREELALTTDILHNREATLRLTQSQVEHGIATEQDLVLAEESVAAVQAEVARIHAQVAQDQNALAVLVGVPVHELHLPAQRIEDVHMATRPAPGLPSDLLTRRPDILAAEHQLWAAGARVGAARAALFPKISLTSALGLASTELTALWSGAQRTWTVLPQMTLPIFDAGATAAGVAAAEAEQRLRLAQYEEAIQKAFQEVADALASVESTHAQIQAQIHRVASTARLRELVAFRAETGLESAFAVHDAERTFLEASQSLLAARLGHKLAMIDLYAALGGGWEETTTPSIPEPTSQPGS
ncbi:MAG: efflux transporter outer membrane subunit [Desulfomicrobiaceae bacterium]